ncbi:DNA methyltransferase [Leptolyngbya sp. O-77]|uniref:DNA methyltransferase n=1 Tax=Leptolyngbya sp. O-77 TaxID=1080068 RepID=UPI0018D42C3A|nr:DNA methyltransferase [Leptolyngbya sp. O-77]
MMYERLVLARELLAEHGSIFVHCDSGVNFLLRGLLSEVFGFDYCVNEIVWRRTGTHGTTRSFGVIHDTIFLFAKSENYCFNVPTTPLPEVLKDRLSDEKKGQNAVFCPLVNKK